MRGVACTCSLWLAVGCGGEDERDPTPPVITTPIVAASDFRSGDVPFIAFGHVDGQIWPNFEYYPSQNADVVAPLDARVVRVLVQDEGDVEVHLKSKPDSAWLVSIDHIQDLTVARGDTVTAGQRLGRPGYWGEGVGQVELQVNDDAGEDYVCPTVLAEPNGAFVTVHADLMNDHEDEVGDGAYDQAAMVLPGCLRERIGYDET